MRAVVVSPSNGDNNGSVRLVRRIGQPRISIGYLLF